MSREKKGNKSSAAIKPSTPSLSRPKKIPFALAALLIIPVLLLVLLELGLRAAGFGYPTTFFREVEENNTVYLINNDKFGWRFFPREIARSPATLKFAKTKTPGTYRIFVFGESAALGDPKPAYSIGRYLEVLLRERFPGAQFEVITVAMTAINSHAVVEIARECARLDADFWVIYMGNNEMAGPFGINPISGLAAPSRSLVRLSLALRATKIGQLAEQIAARVKDDDASRSEWEGLKMFRERRVAPNDPKKEIIYANFRENLRDVVQTGLSSGAKIIACSIASNQRDFAPFASIRSTNAHYLRGLEMQSSNLFLEAGAAFQSALKSNPAHADLHFQIARIALELGSNNLAETHFARARDFDALPLRTDSRLNSEIEETSTEFVSMAGSNAMQFLDLEEKLPSNLPARKAGDETFFDHVHLTFAGNYRAARLIAERIESALPPAVAERRAINWPSASTCEHALGLSDWNRELAFEQMLLRQFEAPFTDQSNHSNRIAALRGRILEIREMLSPRAATTARASFVTALEKNPADFRLRESFAEFLEATGDLREAAEQRATVAKYVSHDSVACYQAGRLFNANQRSVEARGWLALAVQLRPNFPEAHCEIGLSYSAEGKHDAALASYNQALELRPDDLRVLMQRAHSLAASNRRKEAMEVLREAIRVDPDHWEPRYLLAVELAANNEIAEAAAQFGEVIRLRPGYAQAHFNYAVALAKMGKIQEAHLEFQRTLQLDPDHKLASEYLSALERSRK